MKSLISLKFTHKEELINRYSILKNYLPLVKIEFMLKNIFLSFLVLSGIAFLGSCKKCKTCTCTQVTSQTGMQDITQEFTVETCDKDEQDELEAGSTVYQGVPGFEQQVTQTCSCQ